MSYTKNLLCLVTFFMVPINSSLLIRPDSNKEQNSSRSLPSQLKDSSNDLSKSDLYDDEEVTLNDAQESANFFTSELGAPFDTSSDYGAIFDNFPSLPYFPEFGEIFRISHTTTPQPPFSFPDYVRDVFPDRPPENVAKPLPTSAGDTASSSYTDSIGGGRRPARRPPRPASSGTRTKVSKQNQNEQREKPKVIKNKTPNKSRDYPKIFRFTSDRVNLAEFDMKKKMNENYLTLAKGDELDSDKVKRNKFLILHGGVFEIERSGRLSLFPTSSEVHTEVTSPDDTYRF